MFILIYFINEIIYNLIYIYIYFYTTTAFVKLN
jgi:hypothetical protein